MSDLLKMAAERAANYVQSINDRSVAPIPEAVARLDQLDEALPDGPTDPFAVISLLDEICSPATVATTGGRYYGFVIGGVLPAALAANWLAGAWDQNSLLHSASPVGSRLDEVVLRWLLDVLKLPPSCGGALVTGATMANLIGLAAARHSVLKKVGWNVEASGLFGAPAVNVIVDAELHPCFHKALGFLGLGRERVVNVPVDNQGRMRAEALPSLTGPTIVCIQAGNVNTGSFDPAEEICALAHEQGAWVHVDGAFGLWAAASPRFAHLVAGFSEADSWATDCHKWLNVPYDSGVAFVRDADALRSAISVTAPYLPPGERREPMDYTPEMSRRARAIEIWAALRSLGRSGLADLIERTCDHAARFAEGLSAAGYKVLNDVVLNQVLVSFGDAETTRKVIAEIQTDGTCWCGGTVWQGQEAMRISVSSWATTSDDVECSLDAMIKLARKCAA